MVALDKAVFAAWMGVVAGFFPVAEILCHHTQVQEAQLLLRDRATFVSFENVVILSSDTVYPS